MKWVLCAAWHGLLLEDTMANEVNIMPGEGMLEPRPTG